MSFNMLFLFSVVDCCLLTAVVPVWDSDLFGWSGLLLGGPTSALSTSTFPFVVFFLIPIKHVDADIISSLSGWPINYNPEILDEINNGKTLKQ